MSAQGENWRRGPHGLVELPFKKHSIPNCRLNSNPSSYPRLRFASIIAAANPSRPVSATSASSSRTRRPPRRQLKPSNHASSAFRTEPSPTDLRTQRVS